MTKTNTLDELMDLDPLSLTADNIDQIIAHHRKARANAASGVKAKRDTGPKLDITEAMSAILGTPKPSVPTVRRR